MAAKRMAAAWLVAAVVAAGVSAGARGQAAVPLGPQGEGLGAAAAAPADDASVLLGAAYKDERAGLRMSPPAGSRMIARAGLEMVGYVQDQKQWTGSVERVILKDKFTASQYMQNVAGELAKNYRAVQVLDSRTIKYAGHDAARLAASMEGDAPHPGAGVDKVAYFRQWLLIRTGDQEFVVMTLFSPLRDRVDAARTFDAMLANFELLDPAKVQELRLKSVADGKAWLAGRSAEELLAKMNNQPQLFRMRINNEDIGYIRFTEFADPPPTVQGAIHGLHGFYMAIDSISYPPGDAKILAVIGQNGAYWGYKKDRSGSEQPYTCVWDNLTTTDVIDPRTPGKGLAFWLREAGLMDLEGTQIPAEDLARLKKQREDMVRQGTPPSKLPPAVVEPRYILHVTWTGDPTQKFDDEKSFGHSTGLETPIPNDAPAPLPKVLEYTWTRVVDLTKPCEMSFVVYNSQNRKLALRTISVKGKEKVMINGRQVEAVRCTDEMDPGSTTLWVDDSGKILTMRTSDQTVLTPTTAEEMAALWKNKLVK